MLPVHVMTWGVNTGLSIMFWPAIAKDRYGVIFRRQVIILICLFLGLENLIIASPITPHSALSLGS